MRNNYELYDTVSAVCSKKMTMHYSTSFSLGIRTLAKRLRGPVYAIYGFVRSADEIVDSFHNHDKAKLLARFIEDTRLAIENKISVNPILHSFQKAYHQYSFDRSLVDQFLNSMQMDLEQKTYNKHEYNEYILGSAEVVGLMCLRVFTEGNDEEYQKLKPYAMKLGAAFQKINFLRDIKADYHQLGRIYFPSVNFDNFSKAEKIAIEEEIAKDFSDGLKGIQMLPHDARLGVYIAYIYYIRLFQKIKNTPPQRIMQERVRISNYHKLALLMQGYVRHNLNLL